MSRVTPRQDPAKPQDFGSRLNAVVDTVVIHTTEGGSIAGAEAWWDRDDIIASSHYLLDGATVAQRVQETDAAYHAGNGPVNRRSVGIEVVGHCGERNMWSVAILEQLVALVADIVERYAIEVRHALPGIIGHLDVPDPRNPALKGGASHHVDPGLYFPWGPFLSALRAELEPEPPKEVA